MLFRNYNGDAGSLGKGKGERGHKPRVRITFFNILTLSLLLSSCFYLHCITKEADLNYFH